MAGKTMHGHGRCGSWAPPWSSDFCGPGARAAPSPYCACRPHPRPVRGCEGRGRCALLRSFSRADPIACELARRIMAIPAQPHGGWNMNYRLAPLTDHEVGAEIFGLDL